MVAVNDLLKPIRFDVEPNSQKGAKKLKHWLKIFVDFLERYDETATAKEVRASNRLQLLFSYPNADMCEYIEGCETYEAAIKRTIEYL